MAAQADRGVPLSTLCPKYLHSNSTSHTWPFSAIAELIDNAIDPDVRATKFWIDNTIMKDKECLTFMDDGNGLDHEKMHKMLSFGYSDKTAVNGIQPIGVYGNGFKSGSMRLGKDAIVFSKSKDTACVGLLSQTYLENIHAQQILVPIACFEKTEANDFFVKEEYRASLQDILCHSPFKSVQELQTEIDVITSMSHTKKTGTRIIIWNLRRTLFGPEFDFQTDKYDIQLATDICDATIQTPQTKQKSEMHIPESHYSLRAYCCILYLKPRMKIIIRGQKVKTLLITKCLAQTRKDSYKPLFLSRGIPITFGYNTKNKDHYGIMMYHKNRLIKAYERVGCQLKANNKGVGVIGVIECNFLDPTHNKQNFMENDKYRKTMTSLGIKLEEYWNEIRYTKSKEDPNRAEAVEDTSKPDQNWVQCDDCLSWRKLPDEIDCDKLPEKWSCYLNPDPQFRSCLVPEEPEDEDQTSYQKTYKQKKREDKKQEKQRQIEEAQRTHEKQQLARQNEQLQQQGGRNQHHQSPAQSPSTPRTPTPASIFSEADCSPITTNGPPVISEIYSLSTYKSGKRTHPGNPQRTHKKAKVSGPHQETSDGTSSAELEVLFPKAVVASPVPPEEDDETDDDLYIFETCSTPKAKTHGLNLNTVNIEEDKIDSVISQELDSNGDVDDISETNTVAKVSLGLPETGCSYLPAQPLKMTSTTTQTNVPSVKEEMTEKVINQGEIEGVGNSTSNTTGKKHISDASINTDQSSFKQEINRYPHSENQIQQNEINPYLNGDEEVGPSYADVFFEAGSLPHHPCKMVQAEQDLQVELIQTVALKRDSLKEQAKLQNNQLGDLGDKFLIRVQKETSHQACQTVETEERDYKSLFEKANQKVAELIQDKEASLAAYRNGRSTSHIVENDTDEIALEVDHIIRQQERRNTEMDKLNAKVARLEEEKANLTSQCEELRLKQQQREEQGENTANVRNNDIQEANPAEFDETATSSTISETLTSLIELRQNVGRILITCMPDLDLSQVNFQCNVIDEILEQVLSAGPVKLDWC